MPTILAADAQIHACPFDGFSYCRGPGCMAWSWIGSPIDRATTLNLTPTPDGLRPTEMLPPPPEGEGWERDGDPYQTGYENSAKLKLPKATGQRWVRRREQTRGRCGRTQPDHDYDSWM